MSGGEVSVKTGKCEQVGVSRDVIQVPHFSDVQKQLLLTLLDRKNKM